MKLAQITFVLTWLAGTVPILSLSAVGETPTASHPNILAPATRLDARLQPGAVLAVAAERAPLMLGAQTVAVLSQGESITVT